MKKSIQTDGPMHPESLVLIIDDVDLASSQCNVYGSTEKTYVTQEEAFVPVQQKKPLASEERPLFRDELIAMISLALPVILTYSLEVIPGTITIIFVGRMDNEDADTKLYVDAAALAVMYFNIFGMSTGLGFLTALDTLYASAHGANEPSKMGKYLLTGIVLMTILSLPLGIAMCNATNVLLYFEQPVSVAVEAGKFTLYMLPGLPFLYSYELLRKLSQASNQTLPMIVSAVTSILVNIVCGYILVYQTNFGWLGAALARTFGYMSLVPILLLGMYLSDRELLSKVWDGFQLKEAITTRSISKFLALGIPGMIQWVLEWIAFECIALLCGILPNNQEAMIAIGANAVAYQISTLVYMLYIGAAMAGNVRIGNALGAGNVSRAKVASYLTLALGIVLACINVSLIVGFHTKIPYFFTLDKDLTSKATSLLVIVALYQIPDAINCVEQGIFRAIGKQTLAAELNFIAYYVVGIPLGYFFAIQMEMGVNGLWLGITTGLFLISLVNTTIILAQDWQYLSLQARIRLSIHDVQPNHNGK